MAIGFLNGDSVPDLVFGEAYAYYEPDGSVYSMLGNGSGGFTILDSATSSISGIFGAVTVECLDVNGDGRSDVVAGLGRHGVKARGEVLPGRDEGARLAEFAAGLHADLVVSGAYGHSRLREWVLGGVTRSLLDDVRLNRFMSA